MNIRYEVKFQLSGDGGTHAKTFEIETTSINMGFVQVAVFASQNLPRGAEIVSITFWQVV